MIKLQGCKVLKIFISGATPYANNRGVAAIFAGTLKFLERAFPNHRLKVYVWHTYPESSERYHKKIITSKFASKNVEIETIPDVGTYFRIKYIYAGIYIFKLLLLTLITAIFSTLNLPKRVPKIDVLRKLFDSDLIIELNFGDFFTDMYYGSVGGLINVMRLFLLTSSGKRMYMFPQSIGPFKHILTKVLSHVIMSKAKLICIRELDSLEHISSGGVNKAKIKFIPDMSFFIHPISQIEAMELLKREGLNYKYTKKNIGVILNSLTIRLMKKHERRIFLHELASALDCLSERHNASIIFIPHVTSIVADQFDCRKLSIFVRSTLKNRDCSIVLVKEYSVEELWGIVGSCDVIISMLTHPVIAALKAGIPVVAIGYSHKTLGIMKLFNMDRYVLDFRHFDADNLIKIVDDLLRNHDIAQRLLAHNRVFTNILQNFQITFNREVLGDDEKYSRVL